MFWSYWEAHWVIWVNWVNGLFWSCSIVFHGAFTDHSSESDLRDLRVPGFLVTVATLSQYLINISTSTKMKYRSLTHLLEFDWDRWFWWHVTFIASDFYCFLHQLGLGSRDPPEANAWFWLVKINPFLALIGWLVGRFVDPCAHRKMGFSSHMLWCSLCHNIICHKQF